MAGKQFVIHFDYVVNDSRTVRISFSNLYKEFKVSLQLALNSLEYEWRIVTSAPREPASSEMDCGQYQHWPPARSK